MTKKFPVPGIYDMPAAQYHELHAASNSGLKLIARSPLHFMAAQLQPVEPTPAMITGTAVHTAVLEPNLFDGKYVVIPTDRPKRPTSAQRNAKKPSAETVDAIEWWSAFERVNHGRTVLDAESHDEIVLIANAVKTHPVASKLLSSGRAEQSVFWIDPDTDAECKSRVDWLGENYAVDLKTTDDASPAAFSRTCVKYGYHVQAAIYMDGLEEVGHPVSDFYFVVVEKSAPFAVAVYSLDRLAIEEGRKQYKKNLAIYAWAAASDTWTGYAQDITEISLPRYAFSADDE